MQTGRATCLCNYRPGKDGTAQHIPPPPPRPPPPTPLRAHSSCIYRCVVSSVRQSMRQMWVIFRSLTNIPKLELDTKVCVWHGGCVCVNITHSSFGCTHSLVLTLVDIKYFTFPLIVSVHTKCFIFTHIICVHIKCFIIIIIILNLYSVPIHINTCSKVL